MFSLKNYFLFFILFKLSSNLPQCPPYNPNVPPVLFPHEYDCRLYYRCEQSGPELMQCWPPGKKKIFFFWVVETIFKF